MAVIDSGKKKTGVFSAGRALLSDRTLRTDKWWLQPALTFSVLILFVIYATFRAFENKSYFAEPLIDLYTKVTCVKKRFINNKPIYHITINDSVYSTFNGKLFDGQQYMPIPLWESNESDWVDCVIFGQSCDSLDVICPKIKLPLPKVNHVFKFQNMGAYTLAACYGRFNGFEQPNEIFLE
jgi:hypothetical protein